MGSVQIERQRQMINTAELSQERAQRVLAVVAQLIVEACQDAAEVGMPENMLFLALQQYGMSHFQFEQLMTLLVQANKVRCVNHRYYAVNQEK